MLKIGINKNNQKVSKPLTPLVPVYLLVGFVYLFSSLFERLLT